MATRVNAQRVGSLVRALGELVLIVAGILIALFVDDWRQELEDREREMAQLTAVQADLAADSVLLDETNLTTREAIAALRVFRNLDPTGLPSVDSLSHLLGTVPRYIAYRFHTSGFIGLEQAGDLRLVRDPEVLQELNAYYRESLATVAEQLSIARTIHDRFIFELYGDFNVADIDLALEDAISRPITESFVPRSDAVQAWLRSNSGSAFLLEVGLLRVIQVNQRVETNRAELSRLLSAYLRRGRGAGAS